MEADYDFGLTRERQDEEMSLVENLILRDLALSTGNDFYVPCSPSEAETLLLKYEVVTR